MDLKKVSTAAAVPLPNPGWDAQQILSKMMAENDIELFLLTFEHTVNLGGLAEGRMGEPFRPTPYRRGPTDLPHPG